MSKAPDTPEVERLKDTISSLRSEIAALKKSRAATRAHHALMMDRYHDLIRIQTDANILPEVVAHQIAIITLNTGEWERSRVYPHAFRLHIPSFTVTGNALDL